MPSVGDRLSYDGALCTVRYVGEVAGTSGSWLGVEWDDTSRGKHDGHHKGVRYFSCSSRSPTAASFVRPTRPADTPQSFVSALQQKYGDEAAIPANVPAPLPKPIVISGKVAEEVGFDKIRRKLAQLSELKIIILDGARIARGYDDGEGQRIKDICPKVTELDLSRNLLNRIGTVVEICSELKLLKNLRLNGNRFQGVLDDNGLLGAERSFRDVKEVALEETLMTWEEILHVTSKFPSLNALLASGNQLGPLLRIPATSITTTLVSLNLEYNDFKSLSDIGPLASITSLRNLHLKGNQISVVTDDPSASPGLVFSSRLAYLDISYNQVSTWSFVDALPASFPCLVSFRFAHNPIYDNPDLDSVSSPPTEARDPTSSKAAAPTTDEAYMLLVARLPSLTALNFSAISATDRADAEMFYLSRIARQLAAVSPDKEETVLARHRRWAELCEVYGEPAVVRQKEVNPNFLEARLISVEFYHAAEAAKRSTRIPKAFDMYAVKGIAGKLFGLPPLHLRLVWETGEWDPVAGFDEEAGDSSENEDMEVIREQGEGDTTSAPAMDETQTRQKGGRWVKREVELKGGPRQFGYCVDGPEVRIRVEKR